MYNGHESWEHWNVSLWINNDEDLYLAAYLIANDKSKTLSERVKEMLSITGKKTPDGARYTFDNVETVLVEMVNND